MSRDGVHIKSDNREVSIWIGDRLQLKAVEVGKGVEVERGTDLNGWIAATDMLIWCKRVAKLAKQIDSRTNHEHDLYMVHFNLVA